MPPDRKGDVVAMVEEALRKDPDVSNDDLKRKAAEIDSDLEEVSARQFNARYPLQAKRKTSTDTGGDDKQEPRIPKTEPEASRREVIREGLIRFAHDVA